MEKDSNQSSQDDIEITGTIWITPFEFFNGKVRRSGYNTPNRTGDYSKELAEKWDKQPQKILSPNSARPILNKEVITVFG